MTSMDFAPLRSQFRGEIVSPGDAQYDAARKVYNACIDRRPALVAYCSDAADVMAAVNFGRENKMEIAVRGGGHNAGGLGVWEGALVLDLSRIRYVRVDPKAATVSVGGGCVWGDVDHATHPFGLAVPTGFVSSTGVGGLTLGGGLAISQESTASPSTVCWGQMSYSPMAILSPAVRTRTPTSSGRFEAGEGTLVWLRHSSSALIRSIRISAARCSGTWSRPRRCCGGIKTSF